MYNTFQSGFSSFLLTKFSVSAAHLIAILLHIAHFNIMCACFFLYYLHIYISIWIYIHSWQHIYEHHLCMMLRMWFCHNSDFPVGRESGYPIQYRIFIEMMFNHRWIKNGYWLIRIWQALLRNGKLRPISTAFRAVTYDRRLGCGRISAIGRWSLADKCEWIITLFLQYIFAFLIRN